MPEPTPEVAVVEGTVWLRWDPAEAWTTVRRGLIAPVVEQVRELVPGAARLTDPGAALRGVVAGGAYPLGGMPGDCPVHWQVYPGTDESWWVCTLPRGHEHWADPAPHVAATYARVDAVLPVDEAEQALRGRSGLVRLAVA